MADNDTTTGATPGADATSAQAGQGQQTTPTQGATPATGTTATPPATGDEALGETGKKLLADLRKQAKEASDRAAAAEQERDALRAATQTETEKAIAAARKEGADEVRQSLEGRIRQAEVRRALAVAGCLDASVVALAPEFAALKVDEQGEVADLKETVETFRKGHRSLFQEAQPAGGSRTTTASLGDQIAEADAKGDTALAIRLRNQKLSALAAGKG